MVRSCDRWDKGQGIQTCLGCGDRGSECGDGSVELRVSFGLWGIGSDSVGPGGIWSIREWVLTG